MAPPNKKDKNFKMAPSDQWFTAICLLHKKWNKLWSKASIRLKPMQTSHLGSHLLPSTRNLSEIVRNYGFLVKIVTFAENFISEFVKKIEFWRKTAEKKTIFLNFLLTKVGFFISKSDSAGSERYMTWFPAQSVKMP